MRTVKLQSKRYLIADVALIDILEEAEKMFEFIFIKLHNLESKDTQLLRKLYVFCEL